MMEKEDIQLLFFDTFSHESSDDLKIDLVQFPKPLFITEIRIIPLGARVQANFPGGVRLGATNPSQFKIEFFINDFNNPRAATFETFGDLEYNQNGSINLECDSKVLTDGLVLRGWFTTITLAVYGKFPKTAIKEAAPVLSEVAETATAEWVEQHTQQAPVSVPNEGQGKLGDNLYQNTPEYGSSFQEEWPVNPPEPKERFPDEPPEPADRGPGSPPWSTAPPPEPPSTPPEPPDSRLRVRAPRSLYGTNSPDRRPPSPPRRPASPPRRPASPARRPASPTRRPASPTRRPASPTRRPASPPRRPASPARRPASPTRRPASPTRRPASPARRPASPARRPASPTRRYSSPQKPSYWKGDSWEDRKRPRSPATPPPPNDEEEEDRMPPSSSKKHRGNDNKYMDSPSLGEGRGGEGEPFEPILSDEDDIEDSDSKQTPKPSKTQEKSSTAAASVDNSGEIVKLFDPFCFDIKSPPIIFKDPCLSTYEWYRIHGEHQAPAPELALKQRTKLLDLVLTSQFDLDHITEEWVNTVEHACPLLKALHFMHSEEQTEVVDTLVSWVNIGLDYERALNQAGLRYKVRHIKIGVRLTEAMLSLDQDLNLMLLLEHEVDKKLFHLFQQDYMALSIKLLIIKTLDSLLSNSKVMQAFITRDGYSKLLDLLELKNHIRVKFAINNLINKIHMYETLLDLSQTIKSDLREKDAPDLLILLLDQVVTSYKQVPHKITQPTRFFPVSSQVDIVDSISGDFYRSIFVFYKEFGLFESLRDLLSLSHYNNTVTSLIMDFLSILSESNDGLLFLVHYPRETVNELLRILLGPQSEESGVIPEDHGTLDPAMPLLSGLNIALGVTLAHRMKVVLLLDEIHYLTFNSPLDPDLNEIVDYLHQLYQLSFTHEGKHAISHVLSFEKNISLLLKIYKSKAEVDLNQKSPSKLYISDLIKITIKYSNSVPFLITYSKDLIDLNNQEYPDLVEISPYLKPLYIKEIFSIDNIFQHVDILKKHMDNICNLSGEVITTLRILHHMSEGYHQEEDTHEYKQLKYKHAILQLYSLDGIQVLNSLLGKLLSHYEQAFIHLFTNSWSLVSVVSLAVSLLGKMLHCVVGVRGAGYKDLTCVDTLLSIHTLCYYIPPSSNGHSLAQSTCREVVTILLTYTLPVTTDGDEKDALFKSLWSRMTTSVIKHVTNSPHLFMPGLCLLSEMLPLPLPIQSPHDISPEEVTRCVNWRNLWCAHLHPLSSQLQEMIITLSGSSYQPILQLLRRVCIQLSDLAAPTALLVTKAILDTIISNLPDENSPCTNHTARLLHFLACLISHPCIKLAFLHLVTKTNTARAEDKYFSLLLSLCDIYRCPFPDQIAHTTSQDCIVEIIGILVDTSVSLLPPPPTTPLPQYVFNALPYIDTLINIVEMLIDHLSNPLHSFASLAPTLRTLLLIAENDIGFYHIKSCVEFKKDPLLLLCSKLLSSLQDAGTSADYLNTLSSLLELLRECLTVPPPSGLNQRTLSLQAADLSRLLLWSADHPVRKLLSAMQSLENPDEVRTGLINNLSELVKLLDETKPKFVPFGSPDKDLGGEPPLQQMEPLLSQFSSRSIHVRGEVDEEKLSVAHWLPALLTEEVDPDVEQIPCNILEEARLLLPGLDFAEHLKAVISKHLSPSEISIVVTPKKRAKIVLPVVIPSTTPTPAGTGADSNASGHGPGSGSPYSPVVTELKTRKPFVTPMRGRGGFRTISSSLVRGDIFRTRLPNTSRPPSLHVDDFVALETCGQQPTGPTGYNKLSMRSAQDMITTRATLRGRGRGYILQPDRGRFFPSMPQYRPARNILQPNWVPASHSHHPEVASLPPQPGPPPPHYHEPPPHGILHRPPRGGIRPVGWGPPGPPPQIRGPPPGLPQRHLRPPQFGPR